MLTYNMFLTLIDEIQNRIDHWENEVYKETVEFMHDEHVGRRLDTYQYHLEDYKEQLDTAKKLWPEYWELYVKNNTCEEGFVMF